MNGGGDMWAIIGNDIFVYAVCSILLGEGYGVVAFNDSKWCQ